MRLFGLIGYPLAQSFSKKYFESKFEKEGLTDCRFENFSIPDIKEIEPLLHDNPQLKGLAVTIPYKQKVLTYLDDVIHLPKGLPACNCIVIKNGELIGYNTDYIGFQESLSPLLRSWHTNALILGSGGAAAAVSYVLKSLNIKYSVVSRSLHGNSEMIYEDLDEEEMDTHKLIINTTPLGMFPNTGTCPDIPYQFLTKEHLLYDVVYNPEKTMFLKKGEERGAVIRNGLEMLELQAEENWRLWNG